MHEIGLVREVLRTVSDFAEKNNVEKVDEIVLEVGELSLVIPEYLEEIYPKVVAKDEQFRDTKLILEIVPGLAICEDCDCVFNVTKEEGICPDCGSQNKTVYSGKECVIKEIHVHEEQ